VIAFSNISFEDGVMATKKRWSQRVTETSDALTLDEGVFTRDPRAIARSLKRSAERSKRRKSSPYRSAMSMLTFYANRAGRTLPAARKRKIDRAKEELRRLYGKSEPAKRKATRKKATRRTNVRRGARRTARKS
jgi:Protein of unknown function (DUF3175)